MFSNSVQDAPSSVQYTEYGIPIRNLWHMLLYAWNERPIKNLWSLENIENAPSLDALLAFILAKLVQQRLRIGLGRSYVNQNQAIRGIRGRIDFAESMKQQSFERGLAFCEFHQYSANAPKNQIVRSMLARLVQTGNFGPNRPLADGLRHQLRWLTRALDGIDIIELKLDFIRRQQVGRNDSDYRLMLAICELILQRQMPLETKGRHSLPTINREALVLHNIYERFIANFYRLHLKGYTVKAQSRLSWHAKHENAFLPSMQPDLILVENASDNTIILDTKFTAKSLIENKWGKQVFDSSHLYQMYAYLKSQGYLFQHRKVSGILLYPVVHYTLSQKIELKDHNINVETLDLTAKWEAIEQHLLELITE
jgi:5-methylcytosine-specific restriction enzyme subunit McrC